MSQTLAGVRIKTFVKKNYTGWLFASPIILGLLIFCLYPMAQSLVLSFFKYDALDEFEFIGFGNFTRMFTFDLHREFLPVIVNTLIYAGVTVPMNLILGFAVALLVNRSSKTVYVYRVLFYLPVIIPSVASTILWRDIFSPEFGIFNRIADIFGLPRSNYIYAENTAMLSVLSLNFWSVGGGMVLWISSLKNVPSSLYESASLDGARWGTKLVRITIPMCSPMIFYNLITSIIGTLQVFHLYMMNGRGPNDALYFYAVKIYLEAFTNFRMGYACALAWVLFVVIGALTGVMFKTSKWVFYGEES